MPISRHWTDYKNVAIILDDQDTFGCSPRDCYVALGPRLIDNDVIDFERCKNMISVGELLDFYFQHQNWNGGPQDYLKRYELMEAWKAFSSKSIAESSLDEWAHFQETVYQGWREQAMASDEECPDQDDPDYDEYVEANFCRETFDEESDENTILIEMGKMRTH